MSTKYSQREFEKDLAGLEKLIQENQRQRSPQRQQQQRQRSQSPQRHQQQRQRSQSPQRHQQQRQRSQSPQRRQQQERQRSQSPQRRQQQRQRSQSPKRQQQRQRSQSPQRRQQGGKSNYTGTYRHFRVVELDGKKVKIGMVKIKEGQTPLNAARKLLMSIADEKKMKKMNKLNLKAKYVIQETTRGSAHKMFGPYHGKYVKYTAEEMKKAKAAKGKIVFTMRPVVKLVKKGVNHKGGSISK